MSFNATIVSDFNVENLGRYLEADPAAPRCRVQIAPYGQVFQTLAAGPREESDLAFIWTRPEGVVEEFARSLAGEEVSTERLINSVDAFATAVKSFANHSKLTFVASWATSSPGRGLGMLDWTVQGYAHQLARMNLRLAEQLSGTEGIYILDSARWIEASGTTGRSSKHWLTMKCPFTEDVCRAAASDVKAAIRASYGQSRKLIVLDLDNTLWGGVVGDEGWQNLRLGGHDYVGEAYVAFQKALKALARRGIQIAVVSKNEENIALDAIDQHPEMVLKRSDMAGWRINWSDKAQNIVDLAKDLNLGLEAVVFVDDNAAERGRVREALPAVFVPEWPTSPVHYADALRALDCFEQATITAEDRHRTGMYVADRERKASAESFSSVDEWIASLGVVIDVAPVGPANMKRIVQLVNKTNQMNLTSRRLTEQELMDWLSQGDSRALFAASVSDRFGDLGLSGVFSWQRLADDLEIVDFILSCRAMGRRVEDAIAGFAVDAARRAGARRIVARAIPTERNAPCLAFWRQSGFTEIEPNLFVFDVSAPYPNERGITLNVTRSFHVDQAAPRVAQ